MNGRLKKRILILALTQLGIILFSFIYHHHISLASYINISFYVSSALLFTSLLIYTIHSGFYDVISRSFSLAFSRGQSKRRFDEIPALSELVTIDQKPLVFHGLINGLLMLAAIFVYYF